MFEPETVSKFVKIVIADLLLAGDNALVIALATRTLGPKEQFWGRLIGTGGAVALRVLFIAIIAWMLKIPYVQLVGGLLLLWIAWKLVQPQENSEESHGKGKHARTLKQAVWMIIVADVTMSLDNVVAIANIAKGDMVLTVFGLLLSIPLVVWGSTLISKLMTNHRWIVWFGGAVLGHVAGSIIFHDPRLLGWIGVPVELGATSDMLAAALSARPVAQWVATAVPWLLAAILFALGVWMDRRPKDVK